MLPRHLEHGLAGVDPLQAGNEAAVDQVFQPRPEKHALVTFGGKLIAPHRLSRRNRDRIQRVHRGHLDVSTARSLTNNQPRSPHSQDHTPACVRYVLSHFKRTYEVRILTLQFTRVRQWTQSVRNVNTTMVDCSLNN